ncbi:MAG: HlyD family secretion protein [Planctomycetota bacterium]|nr:HlyD family secretion protein [Planctomycetota bacterium]
MWKWGVVALAVLGAIFGISHARRSVEAKSIPELPGEVARNPYARGIAGAGLIEPRSENVIVGAPEAGLVLKVFVTEGQAVKAGDPLFKLDTRGLEADREVQRAALASAEAERARVAAYRRSEDEPLLTAALGKARADVAQAEAALAETRQRVGEKEWSLKDLQARQERLEQAVSGGAWPMEDLERARYAVKVGEAQLESSKEAVRVSIQQLEGLRALASKAQADLDLFRAGAWAPDVAKAEAAAGQARAQLAKTEVEIERRTVRAPLEATVLRVNLREGEFAPAGATRAEDATLVLGRLDELHIRVDLDEYDLPRFKPGAPATAFLKGARREPLELAFVRTEPFVVPKKALTNSQTELVDTRVLQAIYKLTAPAQGLYVGQQVDVYVSEE